MLKPEFTGHGYATEMAAEMLRIGFDELGLHRVVGRLDARNDASARVLERLGMRREALLVDNEWVKGEWTSELDYALLADEWALSGQSVQRLTHAPRQLVPRQVAGPATTSVQPPGTRSALPRPATGIGLARPHDAQRARRSPAARLQLRQPGQQVGEQAGVRRDRQPHRLRIAGAAAGSAK